MYADIEQLVLSGKLFSNSRSSSPVRTPSPDPGWHNDDLPSDEEDDEKARMYQHQQPQDQQQRDSVGMGPGRTGVKGVLRDRDEAQGLARDKRIAEIAELNKKMEKASLGGKTFLEEEREREIHRLMMEGSSGKVQNDEKEDIFGRTKGSRFGHLREVGVQGFVSAVEQEERGVWVVVHLYEPSVDRCYTLDENLSKLARVYPGTKFLRCRAAALGFASTSSSKSRTRSGRTVSYSHADDDDPYADEEFDDLKDESANNKYYDEDLVDTDMLPTMLVYQDGELVHNWVRVDWEADRAGIEELLVKYHILPQPLTTAQNLELEVDDDDDDLI